MAQPSLLELLNKASDYFKSKSIEEYRLDAQLLLGHVLKLKRLELFLNYDRPLTEKEVQAYRECIRRRGLREPLQHIIGEMPFRNLNLITDKRALIPRQETELIVDLVKAHLLPNKNNEVLEIGVGTGAICLSLLNEIPEINIYGVDISQDCIALTLENAIRNKIEVTEKLRHGNLFEPFGEQTWDIIVSNPPYISAQEISELQPEVKDFDPHLALVGGIEGWELPWKIICEAYLHLNANGKLILEIGAGQSSLLLEKASAMAWQKAFSSKDYSEIERFLVFEK